MKLFFTILFFLTSTMAVAQGVNFYAVDCSAGDNQLPSIDPKTAYAELNLKQDGGTELLSTMSKAGFYPAYINEKLYVVSPEDVYQKNNDKNKVYSFPYACSFVSIYVADLGKAAMKQKFEANFQLPKDYKLINP